MTEGIPCSTDHGDTWPMPYCFVNATNLTGTIASLTFKDSTTAIITRRGALPLRETA